MRATVISASGVVLKTLIDALGRAGTQDVFVMANAIGDSFIFEPFPDFVVGVLSPVAGDAQQGLTNLDVMLRIGRSAEQKIPTLLIVPPPFPHLSPMAGVAFAYCPTDNEAALTFHVSAIVATAAARREEAPQEAPVPPAKSGLTEIIEYLATSPGLSPAEFERIVIGILEGDLGSRAIASRRANVDGIGVDVVVSPTDAPDSIILIQAKMQYVSLHPLARSEIELQNYVMRSQASLGLLIFYDPGGHELSARSSPLTPRVVSVSLKNLAEELLNRNLLQILTKATAETAGGETP